MKKIILMILLFFGLSVSVHAQGNDDILHSANTSGLYAGEELEENGVSFDDPESVLTLTPSKLINIVKNAAAEKISRPLRLFAMLLSVVILASAASAVSDTVRSKELTRIFSLICVLACSVILAEPVRDCLDVMKSALSEGSDFMLGFVPVLSGITAAAGNVTSASGYSLIVLGAAELAVKLSESLLTPLLSMCVCIAVVDGCCESLSLGGLLNAVKKIVTWGLGISMTVFTGLLSIQSVVGSSADSVSLRTAKYVLSNTVPLVGAAASEAYSSVRSSVTLLKNGIGGVGIAALCVMLLPPLIHLTVYRISFGALGAVSEIFGAKRLSSLFKNINAVLAAAFGILVSFSLMFIVSTGIVMTFCGGNA